jgi:DNA-damage-inducible protein J
MDNTKKSSPTFKKPDLAAIRRAVANSTMHVRTDENIKTQAAETLPSMGLTLSDAVRVFLTRVVADEELPFVVKTPNARSRAAMAQTDEIINSRRARLNKVDALIDDLEKPASANH